MRLQDIIFGEKYNLLTPKYATLKETKKGNRTFIVCDCECGNKDVYVQLGNFGRNLSCGCSHNEQRKNRRKLHFAYKIGDTVIDDDKNISILARKVIHINGQYQKYYKIRCNKCGFDSSKGCYVKENYKKDYWIPEYGKMTCPCCCEPNKVVQFGINSVYDTNYWMVKYFKDKEVPKRITYGCSKHKKAICPFCKREKNKRVAEIYRDRSIGCVCSQMGKSFFERYFADICEQLSEQFGYKYSSEIVPDWCLFPNFNDNTLRRGRYDYQPDKNRKIYVELDGDFHRQTNRMSGQTVEESMYIDAQKDLLANQNGYTVIRIICDDKNNLSDRILKSSLSLHFDLSNIDFDRALEFAETKIFNDICEDKNNGLTIKQIAQKYQISVDTIRRKVKIGVELGKCTYNPDKENKELFRKIGKENWKYMKDIVGQCNKKPIEISRDKKNWERYESATDLISVSQEKYGYKFLHSGISRVCNGVRESYYGYYFKFAS